MQTALHIYALIRQIRRELVRGEVTATEFYKKERAAYFFVRSGKTRSALVFGYHPISFGSYVVPAGKVDIGTREKPWPVFALDGATITGVEQVGLDRIFRLIFEQEGRARVAVCEAMGPNGNLWLLDENENVAATLRNRKGAVGRPYELPPPLAKINPLEVTGDELGELREQVGDMPVAVFVERHVAGFTRTMAREIAERISTDDPSGEDNDVLARVLREMAGRFAEDGPGYLYEMPGGWEVYPFKLGSAAQQPEKFKTLSLAVMQMTRRRTTVTREADEEKKILDVVRRAAGRLERRLPKIERDIEDAANYEIYRKHGELLQTDLPQIKRGMDAITVDDVYITPPEPVTIKLDPALTPPENVEQYFRRYRKGREGLELLQRRLEITRQELAELERMAGELEGNFEQARERYRAEIDALLPRAGASRETDVARLPYREYVLSTGLKIFVGRDGADNDRTTFEYARPYELWFHAQQCPGSHVVIKYPNKSFEPSAREIEETAAVAAYFSKARNDTLVPVIYAERRYVRKPRKAKAGLVTVEREKSVMVTPRKPGETAD